MTVNKHYSPATLAVRATANFLGRSISLGYKTGCRVVGRPYPYKYSPYFIGQPNGKSPYLNIAIIADPHIGCNTLTLAKAEKMVEDVNVRKPDLILIPGDVINDPEMMGIRFLPLNGKTVPAEAVVQVLSKLQAPLGVFATLGNHDYDYGQEQPLRAAYANSPITLLDNSSASVDFNGRTVDIIGLGDELRGTPDIQKAFSRVSADSYRICMMHNPITINRFSADDPVADFYSSGHTHAGQFVIPGYGPLHLPKGVKKDYLHGEYDVNGRRLIVSSGVGTGGIGARLGCDAEILLVSAHVNAPAPIV